MPRMTSSRTPSCLLTSELHLRLSAFFELRDLRGKVRPPVDLGLFQLARSLANEGRF